MGHARARNAKQYTHVRPVGRGVGTWCWEALRLPVRCAHCRLTLVDVRQLHSSPTLLRSADLRRCWSHGRNRPNGGISRATVAGHPDPPTFVPLRSVIPLLVEPSGSIGRNVVEGVGGGCAKLCVDGAPASSPDRAQRG